MEILQNPRNRKVVEAYQDGHITVRELWEELEWHWDSTMDKETERHIAERARVPMTEILQKDG